MPAPGPDRAGKRDGWSTHNGGEGPAPGGGEAAWQRRRGEASWPAGGGAAVARPVAAAAPLGGGQPVLRGRAPTTAAARRMHMREPAAVRVGRGGDRGLSGGGRRGWSGGGGGGVQRQCGGLALFFFLVGCTTWEPGPVLRARPGGDSEMREEAEVLASTTITVLYGYSPI